MGATKNRLQLSALLRSRFLSAYYVANFLVLASYAVLRPLVDLAADTTTRHQLKTFVRPQRRRPWKRHKTQHSPSPTMCAGAPRLGGAGLQLYPQGVWLHMCRVLLPVPHRDGSPTPPGADYEVPLG